MAGMTGLVAMTTRIATAPRGGGNGAGPEIFELGHFVEQGRFLLPQVGE
jgi:hypothetical protein